MKEVKADYSYLLTNKELGELLNNLGLKQSDIKYGNCEDYNKRAEESKSRLFGFGPTRSVAKRKK